MEAGRLIRLILKGWQIYSFLHYYISTSVQEYLPTVLPGKWQSFKEVLKELRAIASMERPHLTNDSIIDSTVQLETKLTNVYGGDGFSAEKWSG